MRHLDPEEQRKYKELKESKSVKISPMKYTKEIPVKPGWYWVRDAQDPVAGVVGNFVLNEDSEMCFLAPGMFEGAYANNRFEYAGPIEEPEE